MGELKDITQKETRRRWKRSKQASTLVEIGDVTGEPYSKIGRTAHLQSSVSLKMQFRI